MFHRALTVLVLLPLASASARLTLQLQNAPGCAPSEIPTIASQQVFPLFNTSTGNLVDLTLTWYACASRGVPAAPTPPIELCGIMDSSAVFSGTFDCTQGTTGLPKFGDCLVLQDIIIDNLIRPMEIAIPPLQALVVTLADNNTCATVFLNDDANDTYQTCIHTIPDMAFVISEMCPGPLQDGFVGSVRSPVQPGVQNWEVQWVHSFAWTLESTLNQLVALRLRAN
ncbi:hypothetical protein MKEN_00206500 [Mycena kentingensis (nom. inval.)]|nr:hypothetical protein MKEN_00206500 [Mycena kentingensis (nom. inval.)]